MLGLFTVAYAQHDVSPFAGKWIRQEMRGRPRVAWVIHFHEKTMTLTETTEVGKPIRTGIYNLDGSPAHSSPPNQPNIQITSRIQSRSNTRMIISDETHVPAVQGSSLRVREVWELLDNGGTLKAVRKVESLDSPVKFEDVVQLFYRTPQTSSPPK
jgi:hypothetical protein